MIRYIAIGAVVGFVLSVLLLSRNDATPMAAAPAPAPPPAQVFRAPEGIRRRADLKLEDVTLRPPPANLLQRIEAHPVDAGG